MIGISVWKKAWELLDRREKRHAWMVLGVVSVSALFSAVMVGSVMPFLSVLAQPNSIHEVRTLSWLYQKGGFTSDYAFLVALGIGSLATILVANLLLAVRTWALNHYVSMRAHTLSHRLLAAYLRQPYEFFLDSHSGTMSTQILGEVQQAVGQFYTPAAEAVSSFLTIAVVVVLLIWINPVVAIATFLLFGGIYGGLYFLSRRMIARVGEVRKVANQQRFRTAGEALGGIKAIKLLGREAAYVERFGVASERLACIQVKVTLVGQLPQYAMQAVAFGSIIILCLLLVDPEGLSSGSAVGGILPLLGILAFAGQRIMPELSRLYNGLTRLQYGRAAVESIHEDLVVRPAGGALPGKPPVGLGLRSELVLDDLSYKYPKAEKPGLHRVSLSIRMGEKIGVVGSSGAGKTTLADIVLGLLRPTAGRMLVDGREITDENLRAWQQSVGYVPQDIFLVDSSVAENIALGVPPGELDRSRVERAARIAQLDGFIREQLPQGYETKVGERGVRLSGGQRQRIGIARAMYHNADLIVFDEATSALDNVTEREVMAAIDNLPGDKTVLIIAHRLTTVQRCDRILVLESGGIAGFDSWDGLIKTNEALRQIALAG